MKKTIYTIGHSNHSLEEFLAMLRVYEVDCVIDVRSVPASSYSPQFNQESLTGYLKKNHVQYLHFGVEFGARRTDCLNEEGQVDFEEAMKTSAFLSGVARLENGLEKGYHITLMCSEANPLECHRFSFLSRYLYDRGMDIVHILKDGNLASHQQLEKQMIDDFMHSKKYHLSEIDELFGTYSPQEQRNDAYRLKNKEIGYKPQHKTDDSFHKQDKYL